MKVQLALDFKRYSNKISQTYNGISSFPVSGPLDLNGTVSSQMDLHQSLVALFCSPQTCIKPSCILPCRTDRYQTLTGDVSIMLCKKYKTIMSVFLLLPRMVAS